MYSTMQRHDTYLSTSSDGSRHSYETLDSRSTAPTSIHQSPRPSLNQHATDRPIYSAKPSYDSSPSTAYYYPRSSTETYASTTASQDELVEEPESYNPEYAVPDYTYNEEAESNLRPSTPSDFAEFFPSSKRMFIHHDDTHDGNMNLRVDTEDSLNRKKANVQLFHLRMHDLKKMEFSLRRYERSSGREVCNSKRKFSKTPAERRPALTRSVSNALSSMRGGKPEFKRTNSGFSTHSTKNSKSSKSVKRQDSGYGSLNEDDDEVGYFMSDKSSEAQVATNITKLEFSNYAQVEIKRKGAKSSKRYEFEYWGYTYTWKRVTERDGEGKAVSYHLYKNDGTAVAHIVPEMQSPSQVQAEKAAGGWVPPCSMWISDKSVMEASSDIADVIVASGLIALVDDCIKRRFHSKSKRHQVSLPLTPLKMDMEFVGPRAMVEHMFKRRNSGGSTKEREQRGSPLRFAQPVAAH